MARGQQAPPKANNLIPRPCATPSPPCPARMDHHGSPHHCPVLGRNAQSWPGAREGGRCRSGTASQTLPLCPIIAHCVTLVPQTTGCISNKCRQCCVSLLVRDLRLHWVMGAETFETFLLDYEPCANYGNWLYFSGLASDPKDRHFHTVYQGPPILSLAFLSTVAQLQRVCCDRVVSPLLLLLFYLDQAIA